MIALRGLGACCHRSRRIGGPEPFGVAQRAGFTARGCHHPTPERAPRQASGKCHDAIHGVQNYHKTATKPEDRQISTGRTRLGSPRAPRYPHGPLVKAWRSGKASLRGYGDVQGVHSTNILFFMNREVGDAGVASGGAISYFGVNSLRCSSYLASGIGRVIFKHQAW